MVGSDGYVRCKTVRAKYVLGKREAGATHTCHLRRADCTCVFMDEGTCVTYAYE